MGCIGCCGGLGRLCLVLINIIMIALLVVVSLLFTAVWLYPDLPLVLDMYEGDVKSDMELITEVNVLDSWHITDFSLFTSVLYLVWGVAGVGLLLSVCGCIGSCCKYQGCVCVYSVILLIVLLAQPVMIILTTFEAKDPIMTSLSNTLEPSFDKFQGISGGRNDDNGWTFIMWKYNCCGAKGYRQSEKFLTTLSSTKSCCPPEKVLTNTCTQSDKFYVGCVDAIYGQTAGASGYVMYCPFLLGLQAMLVFFGCCMVLKLKLKNSQVSDELEERLPPKLSEKPPKSTQDNVFAVGVVY